MTTQQLSQAVPAGFPGSLPEFQVFVELTRLGKVPGLDFTYQNRFFGGRLEKGGLVIDFLFQDPPDLAINVQGVYWHYGRTSDIEALDRASRAILAGEGITLIFIDEDDITKNVRFFTSEALRFRDHSRLSGGQ
ncbi:hypothetical protein CMI37_20130 [Candidatus Pacearchaeota archaeon]|nr:hypothetical protein [Candidatus Pacearchaeota archaeon]|tara:strand:- start:1246 stop:1647 length:402 start_codon:yes stop_codon:yes gene_type:complete